MLKNYLILAFRRAAREKRYTLINLLGLSVALISSGLIVRYVQDELSYDQLHEKGDRIYRTLRVGTDDVGEKYLIGVTSGPFAEALRNDFPAEIEYATQVLPDGNALLTYEDQQYLEEQLFFTDPYFFDVFSFDLLRGDERTALDEPNSIILTEETARKYFGDEDPMGKILLYDQEHPLLVTGVLAAPEGNSHLDFEMLASIEIFNDEGWYQEWWSNSMNTYVLLAEGAGEEALEARFPAFMDKYFGESFATMQNRIDLTLQPLEDIYFDNQVRYENGVQHGNRQTAGIFTIVAFVILLIAGINFMNLATARGTQRAKEVGVRKALGARRKQLFTQFLTESVGIAVFSLLLATVVLSLILPQFNQFVSKELTLIDSPLNTVLFVGIALGIGLLAGIYPALVLSAFRPARVLKGISKIGISGIALRKGLVVFQFVISIVLIVATLVVSAQLHYLHTKNLGFEKEQTVLVALNNTAIYQSRRQFKERLLQHSAITEAAVMSGHPGGFHDNMSFEVSEHENTFQMRTVFTDHDYVSTLGIRMIAGRNFSEDYATDTSEAVLINEVAADLLGWTAEEALGQTVTNIYTDTVPRQIVGVVEDFHFSSLHDEIDPLVITADRSYGLLAFTVEAGSDISSVLASAEQQWESITDYPFNYEFLDEAYDSLYRTEQQQATIFRWFSLLAILIACLGLFGLITFSTEQRVKEIGIRKVLGASVKQIVWLLSSDYTRLVLLAILLASPLAYYAMQQWLATFAYRTPIQLPAFGIAAVAALGIALLTLGFRAIQAASANPVDSLRNE